MHACARAFTRSETSSSAADCSAFGGPRVSWLLGLRARSSLHHVSIASSTGIAKALVSIAVAERTGREGWARCTAPGTALELAGLGGAMLGALFSTFACFVASAPLPGA